MSGLRFDSMADMPAGMRDLYAKKILGGMPQEMPTPEKKAAKYRNQKAERGGFTLTARRKRGDMTSCC